MTSFTDRVFPIIQNSIVGIGVSLANEVGIFEALAEADAPLSSLQVAQAKGLKERYVRELLGALSTAELVKVAEGENGTLEYSLDLQGESKESLNRGLAYMGFTGVITSIYSRVKDCVYENGPNGVRYNDQTQDLLDNFARRSAPQLAECIPQMVPELKEKLDQGIEVIEFGSGRGRLSAILAQQYAKSHFVASEFAPKVVELNKERWAHVSNLSFSLDDVCAIPELPEKQYDWVFCCDVIHDLPDPLAALQGIRRLLRKPGGLLTFVDVTTSGSPIVDKGNMSVSTYYSLGTFLCIPESYQRESSVAMGPCCGKQVMLNLVEQAGFHVSAIQLEELSALYVCKLPKET